MKDTTPTVSFITKFVAFTFYRVRQDNSYRTAENRSWLHGVSCLAVKPTDDHWKWKFSLLNREIKPNTLPGYDRRGVCLKGLCRGRGRGSFGSRGPSEFLRPFLGRSSRIHVTDGNAMTHKAWEDAVEGRSKVFDTNIPTLPVEKVISSSWVFYSVKCI